MTENFTAYDRRPEVLDAIERARVLAAIEQACETGVKEC